MDIRAWVEAWWSKEPLSTKLAKEWHDWNQSEAFGKALTAFYFQELKSAPAPLYDLLVTQHLERRGVALYWADSGGKLCQATFEELHEAALSLSDQWRRLDVSAGDKIAIFSSFDFNGLAALAAAVRLGLHIGCFPTKTRYTSQAAEQKKMLAFTPRWVVDPEGEIAVDGVLHLPFEPKDNDTQAAGEAHLYGEEDLLYGDVTFSRWWQNALYDGLITLQLRQGLTFAAPFASPLRYEPHTTLLALLFGVAVHRIHEDRLEEIQEIFADVFVMHPRIIDDFEANMPFKKRPRLVVRDPLADGADAWQALIQRGGLKGSALIDWVCESSWGGGVLYSRRKLKENEWVLPTIEPTTAYPFSIDDPKPLSIALLRLELRTQWLITAASFPLIDGQWCLTEEVEKSLESLPSCQSAVVIPFNRIGDALQRSLVAILFVQEGSDQKSMESAARESVTQEVGAVFVPAKIVCTSLTPPWHEGKTDRRWVENQFRKGLLEKKEQSPIYSNLHALRRILHSELL